MRIQRAPKPLLPVPRVHAGVHFGGGLQVSGQMTGCTRVKLVSIGLNSHEKFGVGVQHEVGEFCKHVCVPVAFRMVFREPTWGGSGDIA